MYDDFHFEITGRAALASRSGLVSPELGTSQTQLVVSLLPLLLLFPLYNNILRLGHHPPPSTTNANKVAALEQYSYSYQLLYICPSPLYKKNLVSNALS